MCIRDSRRSEDHQDGLGERLRHSGQLPPHRKPGHRLDDPCLLYTSDAADERSSVDLGGRRIIKKKKNRPVWSRG